MNEGLNRPRRRAARWTPALAAIALALGVAACEEAETGVVYVRPEVTPQGARDGSPSSPDALVPFVKNTAERSNRLAFFYNQDDVTIAPAFIEVMHFSQLGLLPRVTRPELTTFRRITGQHIPADDWKAWTEWWWSQEEYEAHAGYRQLKRHLYRQLNEKFWLFLDPAMPTVIDPAEVVMRDATKLDILPLTDPPVIHRDSEEAKYLAGQDRIVGIEIDGERRAYPVRMLNFHEVVNDTLGGRRVLVYYHPISMTAYAYEVISDGETPPGFGYTGLDYRAASLLFDDDDPPNLWWSRTGEPVMGPRAQTPGGVRLRRIPATMTSWYVWGATYPETTVLELDGPRISDYTNPDPYAGYHAGGEVGVPLPQLDLRRDPKERVFGIVVAGEPIAYPHSEVGRQAFVYSLIAGERVLILPSPRRDEFRAYRVGDRNLFPTGSANYLIEGNMGSPWEITEAALVLGSARSAGIQLERIPGEVTYWYAWQAWHPDTRIYLNQQNRAARAAALAGEPPAR